MNTYIVKMDDPESTQAYEFRVDAPSEGAALILGARLQVLCDNAKNTVNGVSVQTYEISDDLTVAQRDLLAEVAKWGTATVETQR